MIEPERDEFEVLDSLIDAQSGVRIGPHLIHSLLDEEPIKGYLFLAEGGSGKSTIMGQVLRQSLTLTENDYMRYWPLYLEYGQIVKILEKTMAKPASDFGIRERNRVSIEYKNEINSALDRLHGRVSSKRSVVLSDPTVLMLKYQSGRKTLRDLAQREENDVMFYLVIADPLIRYRSIEVRAQSLNIPDLELHEFLLSKNIIPDTDDPVMLRGFIDKMASKATMGVTKRFIDRQISLLRKKGVIDPEGVKLPVEVFDRLLDEPTRYFSQRVKYYKRRIAYARYILGNILGIEGDSEVYGGIILNMFLPQVTIHWYQRLLNQIAS